MKRSLKALLVAGAAAAALVAPAAPAHAQANCIGFVIEEPGGLREVGVWPCSSCPTLIALGDGHFHVILCVAI